ncbi:glycosyl transferase [Lactobacillus amylovorus subsp. animalium]|uniref:glycosyl transferase n=1 Tax=Lactobacillus amylovorus TaxID=1604 RepID=UPI001475B61C|nr:glycosyl transferase [Lactobacillus amylovorus]NME31137.1 glycosyl transferase [Lactobacillus amylovorus]
MYKYQITEFYANSNNAGSKAPEDIKDIVDKLGYLNVRIPLYDDKGKLYKKIFNQIKGFFVWESVYQKIEKNSIVFVQYPQYKRQFNRKRILKLLKKKKNIHIICLIHDIDKLRHVTLRKSISNEFNEILTLSSKIIVHNQSMQSYLIDEGIESSKLVPIKIFDYLRSDYKITHPKYSTKVIIAGNLDHSKSKYLEDLWKVKTEFVLYGSNYHLPPHDNIFYKGALSPNDVPKALNTGYGLVWDGDSIESCQGNFGEYLKYNNPHKLSLYISSNLPVIIWSQAAEAKFVKENDIGLVVDSLYQIPSMLKTISKDRYNELVGNTIKVAKRLVEGQYTKDAIGKVQEELKN